MAAVAVPSGHKLEAITGEIRTLEEWMITFQLLVVVVDPYTYESSWILDTAGDLLEKFRGASVRIGFVCTSSAADAATFLGPWADKAIVFVDPDRELVKALELTQLPALLQIRQNLELAGVAEGWQPKEWKRVFDAVSAERRWTKVVIPTGAPAPYPGSPALE